MCRATFQSDIISLSRHHSDSRSDSDKAMATQDVLRGAFSHCPLKKRPVHICEDINESKEAGEGEFTEPENLSTKPEDFLLKSNRLIYQPAVTVISSKVTSAEDCLRPKTSATLLQRYLQPSSPSPQIFDNRALYTQTFDNSGLEHRLGLKNSGKPLAYFGSDSLSALHGPARHHQDCFYQYLSSTEACGDYHYFRPSKEKTFVSYQENSSQAYRQDILLPNFPFTPSPPLNPEDLSSTGSVASSGCCSIENTDHRETRKVNFRKRHHQCSHCLKFFLSYSGLTKHQRSHDADFTDSVTKKCFGCKSCDKVYVTSGALKMHIRTHTLPCKCVICGKAFSRPWLLQGHIRTHTGEKPFSCPLCERAFADRSNLRAHLQTHSEVKKYSCSSCRKTFSRMSLVTKHQYSGCFGQETSSENTSVKNK